MRKLKLKNRRFGFLKVLKASNKRSSQGEVLWRSKCDCGKIIYARSSHLRSFGVTSCGCARKTHGCTVGKRTREYISWNAMVQRCTNSNRHDYKDYGGRGIKMCKSWRSSFEAFLRDMGTRPKNRTLDRINSNGHYTPKNCRWATAKQQARNKRKK